MKTIMFAFGTRPETIKLAPLVRELRAHYADYFRVVVTVTAQHRQMLDQALKVFELTPEYDLDLMQPNQTLASLTGAVVAGMDRIIAQDRPDMLIVQGDTLTTAFSALAAFYQRVPIAHVEAGLRTDDKYSPFPEEINRRITTQLSDLHFAPTTVSRNNLLREAVPADKVFVTGNTVIDALLWMVEKQKQEMGRWTEWFVGNHGFNPDEKRFVLVTGHRRESFGDGFKRITNALAELATKNKDYNFVYPVHLNPNVQKPVYETLGGITNIHLLPPLDYEPFVNLLTRSLIVLTDSGGVQEEAPALGKPVLVMRDTTERPEGVEAGTAKLIGTMQESIVGNVQRLLDDNEAYREMSQAVNPYGTGNSCQEIANIMLHYFGLN